MLAHTLEVWCAQVRDKGLVGLVLRNLNEL